MLQWAQLFSTNWKWLGLIITEAASSRASMKNIQCVLHTPAENTRVCCKRLQVVSYNRLSAWVQSRRLEQKYFNFRQDLENLQWRLANFGTRFKRSLNQQISKVILDYNRKVPLTRTEDCSRSSTKNTLRDSKSLYLCYIKVTKRSKKWGRNFQSKRMKNLIEFHWVFSKNFSVAVVRAL